MARSAWLLLLVLLLGTALRLYGLDYGLPHPTARPDEERVVGRAQTIFATGDWHPGSFFYPSLPFYLDAAALHLYYRAGVLAGKYERPFDLLFEIAVTRPGLHYRIARAVSAAFGVATALAVYALGASAFGSRAVGLGAALFLAVAPVHVRDSHFATVDVTMTLFAALALVFAVRAASDPSRSSFLLAGLATGLAVSSKYNAGLVALSALAAFYVARAPRIRLVQYGAAALAAFVATSPYVVLGLAAFASDMSALSDFLYRSSAGGIALWDHLGVTLPRGLGWPLLLVAGVGLLRALARRSPADVVLLSFFVPFFFLIASVRLTFPRYVLPLVPVLAVFAAETVTAATARLPRRRLALGLALALLAAPGLWSSIAFDRIASRADTRLQAGDWIAANVRPRARVLVCEGYGAPAVNEDRRRPPAYDVQAIDCFAPPSLSAEDGEILVTHEHRELSSFSRVHPELASWLEENARLLRRFDPYRRRSEASPYFYGADAFYIPFAGFGAVERGGPIVSVWRLESLAGRLRLEHEEVGTSPRFNGPG